MVIRPDTSIPKLGARNTRQRAAVVKVLREMSNFASVKQIHHELTKRNIQVGLTTVYRTLQALVEIHGVDVIHTATGETLYRICSMSHHHHLLCTNCQETVEINGGPVERWAQKAAAEHGFVVTAHTAEIFGLCQKCRAAGASVDSPLTRYNRG